MLRTEFYILNKCKCSTFTNLSALHKNSTRKISKSSNHSSEKRVVITGLGTVSPVGCNVDTAWKTVINSGCGIQKLFETYEKLPCRIAALVNKSELKLDSHFSKSELRTISLATAYALISTKEALHDAKWHPQDEHHKERTGVSVGVGMVDLMDICNTNDSLKAGYNKVNPYFVTRILPNMAAGQISIKYGFRGPNHAVSTACATGLHAIGDAYRFIKYGEADVMVCGGAEACISPLSIAAFCRLRALSTHFNDEPEKSSRPFDKDRDGFVMGEGAGILVLEELEHALKRHALIYAEVKGYGMSGDGAHITAPREDGSGAILSMKRALHEANIDPSEVSYVNAHATSTPLGDGIEIKAIETLCRDQNVFVSSTKGAHGHLLGAAGALETVLTAKSIQESILPPTINLKHPVESKFINFVTSQTNFPSDKKVTLKNAFGFGGTNASLCIMKFIHNMK